MSFRRVGAASLFLCVAGFVSGSAAAESYSVLIDSDNRSSTGCQVMLPGEAAVLDGVEVRLTAEADPASATVLALQYQSCQGGAFGPAEVLEGPYPVGLDLGAGGGDVLEFALPADAIASGPGPLRLYFTAADDSGSDLLATTNGRPGGAAIHFQLPFAIPSMTLGGLVLLAFALLLLARRRGTALPAVVGLVSLAAVAMAAGFVLDGQTDDWAGEPVAGNDPAGDATNGRSQLDIVRGYAAREGGRLFFRMDLANLDNTAPVAVDDGYATDEDSSLSEPAPGLLANDSDPDSDPLDAVAAAGTSAQGAGFQVFADGAFDYDPASAAALQALADGETLDDSFTYEASDGSAAVPATVTVTVSGANDAPEPAADAVSVDEDTSGNALDVLANDTDPEGDMLTVTAAGSPDQGGSVAINGAADGLVYAPAADFAGTETFSYTVGDGNGGSATGTVTVTVGNVNDPPQAAADSATVDEDSVDNPVDVLANDSDPDPADTLVVSAVGTPDQGGSASANGTSSGVLYTPAPDFTGTETFTYEVADGNGGTDSATVTVTITEVNDPPVAESDAFATDEDSAVNGDVLADNGSGADSDPEGDTLSVSGFDATSTQGASVNVAGDGSLAYDPAGAPALQALAAGDALDDTFGYTLSDGNGGTDTATVTVAVSGVNDSPEPVDDTVSVTEDSADNALDVLINDTDPEGDALTVTAVGSPDQGGGVAINGTSDGLIYSPAANFAGTETFSYTVGDGNGGSATATVAVTVDNVNDPPEAADDSPAVLEDTSGNVLDLLANDTDIDAGDTPTITAVGTPDQGGSVTNNGGNVGYTPAADFFGTETFSYTISDGNGGSATAAVTVTVTNVNDPPVGVDDANTTDEDSVLNGTGLLANDTDIDGDTLSAVAASGTTGAGAAFQVFVDGTFTYDPSGQFESLGDGDTDTDSFSYTVSDGNGGTDDATVAITVTGVNDAPTLSAVSYATVGNTLLENGVAATGAPAVQVTDLLSNYATDPEGDAVTFSAFSSASGANGAVNSDGSFTYTPPPGVSGASDSFTVTLSDGTDSSDETVTVNVASDIVWYTDNAVAGSGGAGTSTNPFRGVAELNAAQGAASGPAAGETLFVHQGGTGYDGLLTLLDGQSLRGEGAGLSITGPPALNIPAGTGPTLANASGDVIGLAQNNTLTGFTIGNRPSGRGITGNTFGTLTVTGVGITGSGQALNLVGGTLDAAFTGITATNSTGTGVNLDTVTGSLTAGGTTVSDPRGDGVVVNGSSATLGFGATSVTDAGDAGLGVTGDAVRITSNTGTVGFASLAASSANGDAIQADGGTVTIGGTANTASATGGGAILLNGVATGGWTFTSAGSASSPARGLSLFGVTGALTLNGGAISGAATEAVAVSGGGDNVSYTGSVTNTADEAVLVQNRTGGNVTLSGNITHDDGAGGAANATGVLIQNNTDGATTLSGTGQVIKSGTQPGVQLNSNTGHSISFTNGGLDIDTTSGTGFTAAGGATAIQVTGAGNTIDSTAATALSVQNSTIGGAGLLFQRVSSNNASSGIVLNATGAGGLTVAGLDGGDTDSDPDAGSGGTIQNTTSHGISLTDARNITLQGMIVDTTAGHGISGTGLSAATPGSNANAFTYAYGEIRNAGDSDDDAAVYFGPSGGADNLRDTATIDSVLFDNYFENGLHVHNSTVNADITIADTVFQNAADTINAQAVLLNTPQTGTAGFDLTVSGSTFGMPVGAATATICCTGIHFNAQGSGSNSLTVTESRFENMSRSGSGQGISAVTTQTASMNVNISNNSDGAGDGFVDLDSAHIGLAPLDNSVMTGEISNNTFTGPNRAGVPIRLVGDGGDGTTATTFTGVFRIDGNTISGQDSGLNLIARGTTSSSGNMAFTVTNNNISTAGNGQESVFINTLDSASLCADVRSNTITTDSSSIFGDIGLAEQNTSTMNIAQASQADLGTVNNGANVALAAGAPAYGATCATP